MCEPVQWVFYSDKYLQNGVPIQFYEICQVISRNVTIALKCMCYLYIQIIQNPAKLVFHIIIFYPHLLSTTIKTYNSWHAICFINVWMPFTSNCRCVASLQCQQMVSQPDVDQQLTSFHHRLASLPTFLDWYILSQVFSVIYYYCNGSEACRVVFWSH